MINQFGQKKNKGEKNMIKIKTYNIQISKDGLKYQIPFVIDNNENKNIIRVSLKIDNIEYNGWVGAKLKSPEEYNRFTHTVNYKQVKENGIETNSMSHETVEEAIKHLCHILMGNYRARTIPQSENKEALNKIYKYMS